MRLLKSFLLAVSVGSVLLTVSASAQETTTGPLFLNGTHDLKGHYARTTDQIIVRYRNALGESSANLSSISRIAGARQDALVSYVRPTGLGDHVLRFNKDLTTDQVALIAQELAATDANVAYAEPDYRETILMVPNDPLFLLQGNTLGGDRYRFAWDKATGAGVVVAVVDTGYRPHEDLNPNLLPGYDFVANTKLSGDGDGHDADAKDPGDFSPAGYCYPGSPPVGSSWHGTIMAGIIGAVANNRIGVAGVAFGSKILPVRVTGKCYGNSSDTTDGILWAIGASVPGVPANKTPARVINLSIGSIGNCLRTQQKAIDMARQSGAVVVVAAGNSTDNWGPANCSGVIAVGAGGPPFYPYSNQSRYVDITGPGGNGGNQNVTVNAYTTLDRATTLPEDLNDYNFASAGTSIAAAHVSGVAALMLSRNSSLTPDQVEGRLKSSASPMSVNCIGCGAGFLDPNAAVNAAVAASVVPKPSPTLVAETTASNHTIALAQVITPTYAQVNGQINNASDIDFYKVTLAAGKALTATLAASSPTVDFDLEGYDAAGVRVASSILGAGQVDAVILRNSGTTAVTVYVRIAPYTGSGTYTLTLKQ